MAHASRDSLGTWACDKCDPELKKLRGSCGGQFESELVQVMSGVEWVDEAGKPRWQGARVREDGIVEVEAAATVGGGAQLEGSFTSCPVAGSTSLYPVIVAYRHSEKGRLALYEPEPSAALMEAIDLVGCHLDAIERQRLEELKAKRGASTNG